MPTTKQLEYEELGCEHDRSIVFLHGLLGRPADFSAAMQILSKRFRVIAPEFPIDQPELAQATRGSIDFLSAGILELLDHLELDDVALCGHSLGGQVAIEFCLTNPARVASLILTASAGLYEQNVSGGVRPHSCPEYVREIGQDIFYDPKHITDAQVDYTCRLFANRDTIRFLIRLAKATRDESVQAVLPNINVPALILWGQNDIITPPFVAKEFHEGIKDARIQIFDQCGHAPPVEHPQAFAAAVGEFLDDLAEKKRFRLVA